MRLRESNADEIGKAVELEMSWFEVASVVVDAWAVYVREKVEY